MSGPVRAVSTDPAADAVAGRLNPAGGASNCHAVAAVQGATSGQGAAVSAMSANPSAAALQVRGPGTVAEFRNDAGAVVMSVGQTGFAPSSLTVSGALTAGSVTVNAGDVVLSQAGAGMKIKEGGGAARMGTLTLTGATPVVATTTAVTASSRIFLTTQSANGGTPALYWVSARTAGTSFTVQGTAGDTSVVAWLIVEPAP